MLRIDLEMGCEVQNVERIYWFHLTKTHSDTDFNDGLLPTSQIKNNIWDGLFEIFYESDHFENLKALRKEIEKNGSTYSGKINNPHGQGFSRADTRNNG